VSGDMVCRATAFSVPARHESAIDLHLPLHIHMSKCKPCIIREGILSGTDPNRCLTPVPTPAPISTAAG
jgi:hypothetical protein